VANYTLAVVAHVDRQDQIRYLSEKAQPDLVEVDDGTLGVMGNHMATLVAAYGNAHRSGQEWVVILEDDARIGEDFHRQLQCVLDAAPSPMISLYNGTGYPMQYQRRFAELAGRNDVHFILHRAMRHAVAYALHAQCFELGLIESMTKMTRQKWPPDDAMGAWCRTQGMQVAYTNPSIVEHEDGPSVIGQRWGVAGPIVGARRLPRHAHHFGGREHWDSQKVDNV
jgi:hypothetical protein